MGKKTMNERLLTQVAGISGMGKSYWVKNELIQKIKEYQPVIIFDKMNEYAGAGAKDVPEKWNNYQSIHDFLSKLTSGGTLKGVHVIQCRSINDYDCGIRFFDSLGMPVALVLDEAHFIFDEKKLSHLADTIKNLARFGRHKGISLVLISQRIKDIPTDVRSQFTGLISFRQNEPADVDTLKKKGWKDVEKILALKEREYLIFGELPKGFKKTK